MYTSTINNAVKNFKSLVDMALNNDEVINIVTDSGNVIMLSENDYRNLILTLEVKSNPTFMQTLLDANSAPLDELVDEHDVVW